MKDSVALEALERTQWRCGLVSMSGGRCAKTCPSSPDDHRTPLHHIIFRSHGGEDSASNLLPLCQIHHAKIHGEIRPRLHGPFTDGQDRRYYTEDIGPQDRVETMQWHIWPDVEAELMEREKRIHTHMQQAAATANASRISIATLCAEVQALGLYEIRGYDSAIDYVMGEVGESESGARNCLRVGEFFRVNPHLLNKAVKTGLGWSTIRGAVHPLKKLPGERVEPVFDEMIEAQRNAVPAEAIVESVREAAGVSRRAVTQVTCYVSLPERAVTLEVYGSDRKSRLAAFRKAVSGSGPLMDELRITTRKEQ